MAVKKNKQNNYKKINKEKKKKSHVNSNKPKKDSNLNNKKCTSTIQEPKLEEAHLPIKKPTFKVSYLIYLNIILVLIGTIYIAFPKLVLAGNNITINYNDNYIEPGYSAHILTKDISNKIQVTTNIKEHTIGNYEIIYKLKYLFLTIKKTRKITIIDNVKPVIEIDSDILKICPNEEITKEKIKYQAYDEYDGDLSNKLNISRKDNTLTLYLEDSSHNITTKDIQIDSIDNSAPKITLKGYSKMYITKSGYNEPGYTAIDNCDGDITSKVEVIGTVPKANGTYTITYSVKDSSNNEAKVTRTVIVGTGNIPSSTANGTIYLTFDDGPNEGITNYILDVLKEEDIKATFFVTGNGPDYLIKRIHDEGHTIALHTYNHNYSYIYSSIDNYYNDLNKINDRVVRITGVSSKIIRFPGGSSNTVSRNYHKGIMTELTNSVTEKGYHYFDWNIDSNDAGGANSSSAVYHNVISNLSKNKTNIVLMHDSKTATKNAIKDIIEYGKNNGYTFEKITMDTPMIKHRINN